MAKNCKYCNGKPYINKEGFVGWKHKKDCQLILLSNSVIKKLNVVDNYG
jgi:hypothetical protein